MAENFENLETGQIEIMHQQTHDRQGEAENCDALRSQHDSLAAALVARGIPHDTEMICAESELASKAPNYQRGFTDDICVHCAFGQLFPICNLYKADYTADYVCDSFRYFEPLELEPPHGFLMANGKETAHTSIEPIDTNKAYLIISNGEAFGIAEFEQAAQLKTKQFDSDEWQQQHRITQRERRQWWPDAEMFYVYRLKSWHPYDGVKLYEDNRVIDEPRLTARQWKIISTAKDLPRQIHLIGDAVSITDRKEFVFDPAVNRELVNPILEATYQTEVKEAMSAEELTPLYSLALVRNPRMRVSKKNLIAEGDTDNQKQEGEDMPFGITRNDEGEYCVVNTDTDESMGCHETEAEAEDQLTALRINVEAEEGESAVHTDKPKKRKPRHRKATRLGDFLRAERENLEMSIEDLADQMPITASTVGSIETGEIETPSQPVLEAFSDALNVSLNRLLSLLPEDAMPAENVAKSKEFWGLDTIISTGKGKKKRGLLDGLRTISRNIADFLKSAETKENEADLFMNETGISQKAINGEIWHFTYSTNAFEDREGETFSTKALEKYVEQNEANEDKGFFNLWHINAEDGNFNTDFARKEWQGVVGRFLVEAGPYLDDEKGQAAQEFFKKFGDRHPTIAPEGWGCSPEFKYLPEERATTVYENIWITRTSTLPKMAAANIWTETRQLARSNNMALSNEQMKAAIEVFQDEEFVNRMIAEAESKTADLEAAGVAHKAADTEQEKTVQPQEIKLNIEELAAEVGKQFQADLTPFAEAIATMASSVKEMDARLEKLEGTKKVEDKTEQPRFVFEWKRASDAEETKVTDDDATKMKPVEAEAKGGDPWGQVFNK